MALHKPYADIPGTVIFDADQSRRGYWLNQFCLSLMKPENRQRYLDDRRAYLDGLTNLLGALPGGPIWMVSR